MSAETREALRAKSLAELKEVRLDLRKTLATTEPEDPRYGEALDLFDEVVSIIAVKELNEEGIDV